MSLPHPSWNLVTLNSINLDTGGRISMNSHVLTQRAPRRRKNRTRPGVGGQLGSKWFRDPRDVQLQVFLDGRWTYSGSAAADPIEAVEDHVLYLATNILDAAGDSEGAVTCTVTGRKSGRSFTGPVQVNDLVHEPGLGAQVVTFDITLLRGQLAVT